jgi:hypothetical protein
VKQEVSVWHGGSFFSCFGWNKGHHPQEQVMLRMKIDRASSSEPPDPSLPSSE